MVRENFYFSSTVLIDKFLKRFRHLSRSRYVLVFSSKSFRPLSASNFCVLPVSSLPFLIFTTTFPKYLNRSVQGEKALLPEVVREKHRGFKKKSQGKSMRFCRKSGKYFSRSVNKPCVSCEKIYVQKLLLVPNASQMLHNVKPSETK